MSLFSRIRTSLPGGSSVVDERPSSRPLDRLPETSRLNVGSSPSLPLDGITLSQHYTQMAQDLRLSMPFTCRWLDQEDVRLVGEHSTSAGLFANIWEATHDGRKVLLKSYRFCSSLDVAQVVAVRSNHALCRPVHY